MESHATSKGQVVIPASLRKKYGIKPGTRIAFWDDGERIILEPITRAYLRRLRGSLKGGGALKILAEEREKERER